MAEKVRKPKPFTVSNQIMAEISEWDGKWYIESHDGPYMRPKDARRKAAWLTQASAWIEQEERGK